MSENDDGQGRDGEALEELEYTLYGGPDDDGVLGLRKLEPSERRSLMIAVLNLVGDLRQVWEEKRSPAAAPARLPLKDILRGLPHGNMARWVRKNCVCLRASDDQGRDEDILGDLEFTFLGEPDEGGVLGLRKLEPSEQRNLSAALLSLLAGILSYMEKALAALHPPRRDEPAMTKEQWVSANCRFARGPGRTPAR